MGNDSWLAYLTDVNPSDELQFVSSRIGFSLAGEPANQLDDRLTTGPGAQLAWPSPAVLVTTDGGRGWSRSISDPAGFWGIDFADARHGWAVGVTALYRTVDGGRRWERAAEPGPGGSHALVRVVFTGANAGFGLTTRGRLVDTDDAGASWRDASWTGRGTALCVQSRKVLTVADGSGGIWRSSNDGISWSQVAADLQPVEQYAGWWVDLSCDGGNGVELAQAFCEAACGGGVISTVRQTTDAGASWREIAHPAYGAGNQSAPLLTRAVALADHNACLVFSPAYGRAVLIRCTRDGGGSFHRASVPSVPHAGHAPGDDVFVQGATFVDRADGWLLVEDDAMGSPNIPKAQPVVWSTDDGGSSWRAKYLGPIRSIPPYSP